MECLLRQLIERAESEGGESWLRKCLSLPSVHLDPTEGIVHPITDEPAAEYGKIVDVVVADTLEEGEAVTQVVLVPGPCVKLTGGGALEVVGRARRTKGQKRPYSPPAPSSHRRGEQQ